MIRSGFLAIGLLIVCALPALSAPFSQGDFASPSAGATFVTLPVGSFGGGSPWSVVSGNVDLIGGYWAPYGGVGQSVDLNGTGMAGSISQTFDTIIGNLYSVTFAVSQNIDGGQTGPLSLTASAAAFSGSFDSLGSGIGVQGGSNSDSLWALRTFNFVATSTSTTLNFASNANPTSSYGPVVSAVSVADLGAEVPEPASLAVWGLVTAVGSVVAYRRRRQAKTDA